MLKTNNSQIRAGSDREYLEYVPREGERLSILVVEDEDGIRSLISACLNEAGYDVFVSSSGVDALRFQKTCARAFDLLITDIRMPGLSGIEVAKHFTRVWPHLPVVFLSGQIDDAEIEQELPETTRFHVLEKPFALHALRNLVAGAIGGTYRRA